MEIMPWYPPDAMQSWMRDREQIRSIGIHVRINRQRHVRQKTHRIIKFKKKQFFSPNSTCYPYGQTIFAASNFAKAASELQQKLYAF